MLVTHTSGNDVSVMDELFDAMYLYMYLSAGEGSALTDLPSLMSLCRPLTQVMGD